MLRLGGALHDHARKILDHAHFSLKPHPFGVTDAARPWWQEFLGCSNEETYGKSIRIDFVAILMKFYHSQGYYRMNRHATLAVGALPPFPLSWGGGARAPSSYAYSMYMHSILS